MAFPASSQLPDEIIKEILAPALYVLDETFADTALKASPFATYGLSSSTILVVCKSWLRVATPLLYDTVVLRSKAQAQALAAVLKKDSQLGTFIKKVRIEGGYGNAVFEILKRSPHVTDIWISTALWSNESVAGYAKGLLLVDPRRLIVVDDCLKASAIRERVHEALYEAIKQKWKNLKTVVLDTPVPDYLRTSGLINTLAQSPAQIDHLELHGTHWQYLPLMTRASVKSIRFITRNKKPDIDITHYTSPPGSLEDAFRKDRALYNKVVYESRTKKSPTSNMIQTNAPPAEGGHIMAAPLDPNWAPLANASPEERDVIWTNILTFAMSPLVPGIPIPNQLSQQGVRASLVRVCKEFNRIGTPLLYQVVMLAKSNAIVKLTASPYKRHIKEIWLQQNYGHFTDGIALDANAIADLVESCRHLVIVSQARVWGLQDRDAGPEPMPYLWNEEHPVIKLPVRALTSLSEHSAGTLQHLNLGIDLNEDDEDSDMELTRISETLGKFRELQSLMLWSGGYKHNPGSDIGVVLPRDAFPKVERLRVSNNSLLNSTFIGLLVDVELPSLKHVTLRAADYGESDLIQTVLPFFQAHGHKVRYLNSPSFMGHMFSVFPNLTEWEIIPGMRYTRYNFDFLHKFPEVHYAMKSIKFVPFELGPLAEFLFSVDFTPFRALETVHVVNGLVWPTNQRDIDKSTWVRTAERMQKWNIKLLDCTGKAWIPRLKPATASRSRKK